MSNTYYWPVQAQHQYTTDPWHQHFAHEPFPVSQPYYPQSYFQPRQIPYHEQVPLPQLQQLQQPQQSQQPHQLQQSPNLLSRFVYTSTKHNIEHILTATNLSKSTVLVGLVYISRYGFNVSFVKVVVALMLANKFNDDNTFTNKSWSDASGIPVEVLNREEKVWLEDIKWSLLVNESDIWALEQYWESWIRNYYYMV